MICKLCCLEKEPKSNTHYLTDSIIKSALNEGGSKERGKGLYWSIDPRKTTIGFKYQQNTSSEKLEKLLGRKTSEEENADAKENIDFTVNDSFCKDCEDIFTKIENEFSNKIISKFRNQNLDGIEEIELNKKDSQILRLFFLIQFWRTSECDSSFNLSSEISEFLRKKILYQDYSDLEEIPLSVTYLQTTKEDDDLDEGDEYKTENVVSPVEGSDPFAILMNDFVIQLYEDETFPFYEFYGYNEKKNYVKFLNQNEVQFTVKVISNSLRKKIAFQYFQLTANEFMSKQSWVFLDHFTKIYKKQPTDYEIGNYLQILAENEDIMKFTDENLYKILYDYTESLYP